MIDNRPNTKTTQDLTRHSADNELMRQVQMGNGDALAIIFGRYHRLVLVTAFRILHDMGEAEDLMQSVFFEIYLKAAQFDPAKGSLSKWILQYAYHRSINRKNYLTARNFYEVFDKPSHYGEEGWLTQVTQPSQDAARLAQEALAFLSDQQRQVVELVFFAGLSLKEIAEQTKQTYDSVRHHYYRGLKCMRDGLMVAAKKDGEEVALVGFEEVGSANA